MSTAVHTHGEQQHTAHPAPSRPCCPWLQVERARGGQGGGQAVSYRSSGWALTRRPLRRMQQTRRACRPSSAEQPRSKAAAPCTRQAAAAAAALTAPGQDAGGADGAQAQHVLAAGQAGGRVLEEGALQGQGRQGQCNQARAQAGSSGVRPRAGLLQLRRPRAARPCRCVAAFDWMQPSCIHHGASSLRLRPANPSGCTAAGCRTMGPCAPAGCCSGSCPPGRTCPSCRWCSPGRCGAGKCGGSTAGQPLRPSRPAAAPLRCGRACCSRACCRAACCSPCPAAGQPVPPSSALPLPLSLQVEELRAGKRDGRGVGTSGSCMQAHAAARARSLRRCLNVKDQHDSPACALFAPGSHRRTWPSRACRACGQKGEESTIGNTAMRQQHSSGPAGCRAAASEASGGSRGGAQQTRAMGGSRRASEPDLPNARQCRRARPLQAAGPQHRGAMPLLAGSRWGLAARQDCNCRAHSLGGSAASGGASLHGAGGHRGLGAQGLHSAAVESGSRAAAG